VVLGIHPIGDLGLVTRFQPPIRVGYGDAVKGVDDVLPP
jgi:hypothetical protein